MRHAAPIALALLAAACAGDHPAPRQDSAAAAAAAAMPPAAAPAPDEDLTVADTAIAPSSGVSIARMRRLPSGVLVRDVKTGTGAAAKPGSAVTVQYVGRLTNGTVFDDSRKRGKPAKFILGQGVVIKGWDEGIEGMRAGGRRQLVVPPASGYGKAGKPGTVPSRATLVFDVELVAVR